VGHEAEAAGGDKGTLTGGDGADLFLLDSPGRLTLASPTSSTTFRSAPITCTFRGAVVADVHVVAGNSGSLPSRSHLERGFFLPPFCPPAGFVFLSRRQPGAACHPCGPPLFFQPGCFLSERSDPICERDLHDHTQPLAALASS